MEQKKRLTIIEIAKSLGIAPSTVSRAFDSKSRISDDTRKKILEFASLNGYTPNRSASRLAMRDINITVVISNVFDIAVEEYKYGIGDAYSNMRDYKININTYVVETGINAPAELKRIIGDGEGIDGLIVSGFTDARSVSVLNEFYEKNKNLVLLQADVPGVNRLFTVGHDYVAACNMAAEFISDCLRFSDKKSVALFTGNRRMLIHKVATDAFSSAARSMGLEIVGSFDMNDEESVLEKRLRESFSNVSVEDFPSAIYITSGLSLPLCRFLKEKGLSGKTVVVTTDVYPGMMGYLEDGTISATLYQDLRRQAKNALTKLIMHIIEAEENKPTLIVPRLVMKSNLRYYADDERPNGRGPKK